MHIGLVTPCDISLFSEYIDEDYSKTFIYENSAPAVNTLILGLLKAGIQISIYTTLPIKNDIHLKGKQLNIYITGECSSYPWKYLHGNWINALHLKKLIQNNLKDINILHAHWTYEFAWAAGQFAEEIPVICTVRDWAPYIWTIKSAKDKITSTFRLLLNNLVFKNKKIQFVANSPYTANRIQKKYNLKVPIIPNPIKADFVLKTKNEKIEQPIFNIVTITQYLDKRKNIESLLIAFNQFHQKYDNSSLILIGSPFVETNEDVKKWRIEGLLNAVVLKGSVKHEKLFDILDNASLLVHPSLEETFGNTLIEAMARKVPVLGGTNSGAVPYVLDHGQAGFLCDVISPMDILNKMEYIYNNKEISNEKTDNATELLLSKYIDLKIVEQHMVLYSQRLF